MMQNSIDYMLIIKKLLLLLRRLEDLQIFKKGVLVLLIAIPKLTILGALVTILELAALIGFVNSSLVIKRHPVMEMHNRLKKPINSVDRNLYFSGNDRNPS